MTSPSRCLSLKPFLFLKKINFKTILTTISHSLIQRGLKLKQNNPPKTENNAKFTIYLHF